jgi:SnoaL-like polyketide cyclase
MSTEENKAIVRRFAEEIWNEKRLDRADEIMAQDYIDHGAMPEQAPGPDGFKRKGAMWVAAVPDLRVRTRPSQIGGLRRCLLRHVCAGHSGIPVFKGCPQIVVQHLGANLE